MSSTTLRIVRQAGGILLALGVLLSAVSCAVRSPSDTREIASQGVLVIESNVDAAAVIDGGAPRSLVADRQEPLPVAPGPHRVEIVSDGYLTRRFDVDVDANEALVIEVQMWPEVEEIDDAQ